MRTSGFTRGELVDEGAELPENDGPALWGIEVEAMGKGHRIVAQCTKSGEPFFVLRGKDILSLFALRYYEELVDYYLADPEMGEGLTNLIYDLQHWQRAHPAEIRLPD